MELFYKNEANTLGPVPASDLRTLAFRGVVTPDTLLRAGTDGVWVRAGQYRCLFQSIKGFPPPQTHTWVLKKRATMTVSEAWYVLDVVATALLHKDHCWPTVSALEGYDPIEICTAFKLLVADEFLRLTGRDDFEMKFAECVGEFGSVVAGVASGLQFVADDQADVAFLPEHVNSLFDDPRVQSEEVPSSFAEYCRSLDADDPLFWQKVYARLGLEYRSNSPVKESVPGPTPIPRRVGKWLRKWALVLAAGATVVATVLPTAIVLFRAGSDVAPTPTTTSGVRQEPSTWVEQFLEKESPEFRQSVEETVSQIQNRAAISDGDLDATAILARPPLAARPSGQPIDWERELADILGSLQADGEAKEAFERGATAIHEKKWESAISAFSKAIRLDPNDAAAYLGRSIAYDGKFDFGRGIADFDRAIAGFTEAIRLNPNDAVARCNRALAYRFQGHYDKAIADGTQAIRLDPKYAPAYHCRGSAHLLRGLTYEEDGDYDAAIVDYTEALRLDPKNAAAYYFRGIAHWAKGEHAKYGMDLDEAERLGFKP